MIVKANALYDNAVEYHVSQLKQFFENIFLGD